MSASTYYICGATAKNYPSPEIKFRNSNTLLENNSVEYDDYALFRFNIIVQTAHFNNEPIENSSDTMQNFSLSCTGNMQVYPTAFYGTHKFTLDNVIEGSDLYQITDVSYAPFGRMFYCTDTIFNNLQNTLLMKCNYSNGNSTLTFDFDPYTIDDEYVGLNLIYSINIELLNSGKIPHHSICTNHFQTNI